MNHDERMGRFHESDLYVVITESFCGGRSALDILDAVLAAGVSLVQFREKDLEDGEFYARARVFREKTLAADALLIIDDRLDVALAIEADGVHLGQRDLPVAVARSIAPELLVGASTHNLEQALAAQCEGASMVNIGPIFATNTKVTEVPPVGPEMIGDIAPQLNIPFTCMGGIKPHNLEQVLSRGARHVAVVTAVTAEPGVLEAAASLRRAMAR